MHLPAKVAGLEGLQIPDRPLHLAIGMFDGVHLGHQSVLGSAVHSARSTGGIAAALTFWPHPSRLFRPHDPVLQIMAPEVKEQLIRSLGIELLIQEPFTAEFASLPADSFLPWLRQHLPKLTSVYVGENWRFGKGRKGDIELLVKQARPLGITVVSAPRLHRNGQPISSTRIRDALLQGDLDTANSLLGFPYFSESEVTEGRKLGHTIGFPTLNLPWAPELKPRYGVYAVRVGRPGEERLLPGAANYGLRPTVEKGEPPAPLLEVHLLAETCPFSAGDRLHVDWLDFLRPEQPFPNLEVLKKQIQADVEKASLLLDGR